MPKLKWQPLVIAIVILAIGGWALYRGTGMQPGSNSETQEQIQNQNTDKPAAAKPAATTPTSGVCQGQFLFPKGGESWVIGTPQNPAPKAISWKMPATGNNYSLALELLTGGGAKLGNFSDISFIANSANSVTWNSHTIYTPDLSGNLKPSVITIQPGSYKLRLTYRYTGGANGSCAEQGSFTSGTFTFTKN